MILAWIYNIVNVLVWGFLAYHFDRWWIMLCAWLTMMTFERTRKITDDV